jgi:flagella synthesis protein FlgN
MNNNNNMSKLAQELEQELFWVKELNILLAEEKTALSTRQFDKLEALAEKKQKFSTELEKSTKSRLLLIGATENVLPHVALQEYIKTLSPNDAKTLTKLSKELSEQITICQELNTINGQAIATNIHMRQEIIKVLTGSTEKDAATYTATGDIKNDGPNKPSHHEKA